MPRKGPAPQASPRRRPGLQLTAGDPAREQDPDRRQAFAGRADRRTARSRAPRRRAAPTRSITLKRALDNVRPTLEVKSRRVGGATYQVPVEVKPGRATTLALRWLVGYSRQRREKTMTERLMNELLDASNGLGASVKRREDTHKMADRTRHSRTTAGSAAITPHKDDEREES